VCPSTVLGFAPERNGGSSPREDIREGLRRATESGVSRIVLVSSAKVYGAWADNPVPLTEDAPLRPNPGSAEAAAAAEAERAVQDWRTVHGGEVVVLRAAPSVWDPVAAPVRGVTAPVQFLHPDDLRAAVDLASAGTFTGVYNVAPDSWIPADVARALVHGPLSVAVPERVARAALSPAGLAYRVHPWVVANDRLRAQGWCPSHTSEEAWVLTHRAGLLERLGPTRRQELALAATVGAMVTGAGAAVAAIRRRGARRAGP